MGLFDFVDRAMIQTFAYRAGVGMLQIRGEFRKRPLDIPNIKGLLRVTCEMVKKMETLAKPLNNNSIETLKVDYNGSKISYNTFVSTIIIDFQNDLKREAGLNSFDFM